MDAFDAQAATYLELMFGAAVEDGLSFYIWTLRDKRSRFFRDVAEAAEYVLKVRETSDVYAGMALFRDPPTDPFKRGEADQVDGVAGLWADIDVANKTAHKKKGLPSDLDDAFAVLEQSPRRQSFSVMSGYGVQPYWLYKEPWIFDSPDEREEAYVLSRRFAATVKAWADHLGFVVDQVFDLTRVLRVPGSFNRKNPKNPREVTIDLDRAKVVRYNADEIEPTLVAREYLDDGRRRVVEKIGVLRLDPMAEPPSAKVVAMAQNDQTFNRTIKRERTDLGDQSQSSYDMALANMCVAGGWSDQEIANLLIAHRRQGNQKPKLRLDYMQMTIGKARSAMSSQRAITQLETDPELSVQDPSALSPGTREKMLNLLSTSLGIRMKRWIRQGAKGEESNYTLVLEDDTEIPIGPSSAVMNANTFAAKVYDADLFVPSFKQDRWRKVIVKRLLTVVEVVDNIESSRSQTLISWLQSYLPGTYMYEDDSWTQALPQSYPFYRKDRIYVHAGSLLRWLKVETGETVKRPKLWDMLRSAGFTVDEVTGRHDGHVLRRSYWHAPRSVIGDITTRPALRLAGGSDV